MASSDGSLDISGMSVEQLDMLRKQTDADIKSLSSNLQQLRTAQQKFLDSAAALSALPQDGEGREMLVPLTSSLYAPGKLGSLDEVLVDVGTGFFVGKSVNAAADILSRKAAGVKTNADQVAKIVAVKRANLEVIENMMQAKIEAARAAGGTGV